MLWNDEASLKEVEKKENKYRNTVARYDISMEKIGCTLREIIQGNGKIERDRGGRKTNGGIDHGNAAECEEERRRK